MVTVLALLAFLFGCIVEAPLEVSGVEAGILGGEEAAFATLLRGHNSDDEKESESSHWKLSNRIIMKWNNFSI